MHITNKQKQKLAKNLRNKMIELYEGGEKRIKAYEVAFQDVIEEVFPGECWWEVTGCQIFMHLLEYRNPEATVFEIVKELKED